jgi:hypothetical protein
LKRLNRNTAAYKDLEEAITKAHSRETNAESKLKLGTAVVGAATHSGVLAGLDYILRVPSVKAKLAIALSKAKTNKLGMAGEAAIQFGNISRQDQGGSQ